MTTASAVTSNSAIKESAVRAYGYGLQKKGSSMEPLQFDQEAPCAGEVALKITHCGVCHTDRHFAHNDFGGTLYPCVPGHEITGIVAAVGAGVTRFAAGDRVGVGCMINSCRQCEPCKTGNEQYCAGPISCTLTYNGSKVPDDTNTFGGYSTAIVVREEFVLRIPDAIDNAHAAPILCAGVTTYSPLKKYGLKAGQTLGVAGIGGLGHMAIQIGKAMGAKVIAFTTNPEKEKEALALGADRVVSMNDEDALKELAASLDMIINTIPYPYDPSPYLALLKPNTTFILVGSLMGLETFDTAGMVFGGISIAGSLIGGIPETQEVLDFCAEHGISPRIEIIDMADIETAWDRMKNEEVRFRYVIDMATLSNRTAELAEVPLIGVSERGDAVGRAN